MKTHFQNNNSKNLIVFFCGWSLDEKPFMPLNCKDYDVLFVFDYSDLELDFDFDFDFSEYEKKILIAFSYGVYVASITELSKFDLKVAVNGTLKPIDKEFGIAPKVFDLMLHFVSEAVIKKFHSKMFSNKANFEVFKNNSPQRTADSCKKELAKIKEYSKELSNESFKYDKVLISDNDKIIPTKNQFNFWQGKENILNGGHFLFYRFKSFDEIINL